MLRFIATMLVGVTAVLSNPVSAETITIDYSDTTCATGLFIGRQGPITYNVPNLYTYGECGGRALIGDDGWSSRATIRADAGSLFDVEALSLSANSAVESVPTDAFLDPRQATWAYLSDIYYFSVGIELAYEPTFSAAPEFAQFSLIGSRYGAIVAERSFSRSSPGNGPDLAGFAGLDTLTLSMRLSGNPGIGSDTVVDGDRLYGCRNRCGSATLDDVVLRVYSETPSSVPLPASLGFLGLGLGGLAFAGRRRSPKV